MMERGRVEYGHKPTTPRSVANMRFDRVTRSHRAAHASPASSAQPSQNVHIRRPRAEARRERA